MLNSTYTLPIKKREGDFPLSLPIDSNWSSHKNRMLIVCETVDSKDLKDGRFLSERSKTVLVNTLNFAKRNARKIKGEGLDPFGFAAINFNNAKTYHFKTEIEKAPYQARFVRRIYKAIETLKPTHVLVCGDLAMHKLFPDIDNSQWKRGWVHTVNLRDLKLKVTSTLDLEPLYVPKKGVDTSDDDDDNDEVNSDIFGKANLLGYVARNITNLLLGRHAFSLKHIVPKPIYIDTIERFDWFYKKLEEASIVAVDTETKDLSATKNLIYTIQFAFSKDKGYVIPMYHPQTPFSQEELKYIRSKLKKWFAAEPESDFKFMLMMNGKFDIKVARNQFCLPIILRPVWEVTAGEHVLDENLKWLKKMGNTPAGNLRAIFTSYDNDLYWTLPFSKDERATIAFVKPSNKDFQNYAVLDVQCLHGIYEMQIAQSKLLEIEGRCYTPYFKLLVSEQMNNTVHTLSHMESRGVGMDGYYLAHLKSKESPLVKTLDEVKVELSQMLAVKKANKLLLERDTSTASGGLFTKTNWVFNLNKPEHKTTLFFDVMGLEPLTYTKTKQPQVDKNFQKAYKDDYKEVRAFATYQEVSKLWGAYVKGWYTKIKSSPDGSYDGRLRPSYGFFDVVTGRLNSFDPSLQQVPSRGSLAKYIKRAFVAPTGTLHVKFDFSAHEVRFWGIIAKDDVIADTFRQGQKLRQKFRKTPSPEISQEIKKKGDVHIINIYHFFKKWVEKSDPLRDAIKAIVFGTIYSMSANSLSKSLKKQRVAELEDKIRKLTKREAELKASL